MRRRRRRISWALLLGVAIIAFAASYVFGISWWQASQQSFLHPRDLMLSRLLDVVVVGWMFWVGSSIGSFLNVVAWRMPRGESINGRSFCPRCHTRLKARDNFPVFGWLALRGRCRCCRLPISARYPIVEAAVGTSLTLVGICEFYRLSLPFQETMRHGGVLWVPVIEPSVLIVLVFHVFALSYCWAMGLIRMDGNTLPAKLSISSVLVLVGGILVYPTNMVVPWQMKVSEKWTADGIYLEAIMRVFTALVAAVLYGRSLASWFCPEADPKLDPLGKGTKRLIDLISIIAVPAIVVGWQSIAAVLVIASLLSPLLSRVLTTARRSDSLGFFAIAMPIALTVHLVFWRWMHAWWFWPSPDSPPWVIMLWAVLGILSPVAGAIFNRTSEVEAGKKMPSSDPVANNQTRKS